MKKVAAVVLMGTLGFAGTAAADNVASHVFTWSGSVPAASTQNGYIIKAADASEIKNGSLIFTTDTTGKGILQSSSELDFNVFEYTSDTVGEAAKQYTYEMTNFAVNNNGLLNEQPEDGYYKVMANGKDLVKNTPEVDSSGSTILTIVAGDGTINQPNAGDDVAVQATIVITDASMPISPN